MKPRLIPTPTLSVRERALLLATLAFAPERAGVLLGRVFGKSGEGVRAALPETARAGARAIALELRRLFDQRFEGLERVHPTWLLAPLEGESPAVCAAWYAELPPSLRE